jgi:hypothetical protein
VSYPSIRRLLARTESTRRANLAASLRAPIVAALVGAGVVLAVHFGRPWAEHRSPDCKEFSDCLDSALRGDALLAVMIAAGCFIILGLVLRGRVAVALPFALVVQGALMFIVERLDGYWLPLSVDVLLGAVSWAVVAVLVTCPRRRRGV